MKPRLAVIRFPGTNREREAYKTAKDAGFEVFYFRWNDDKELLKKADAYVLPGGFSYEDRSRSGIMCALDPVMEVIREEARKGKAVLGICNGAQMLVESGMVPGGVENKSPLMCLARNVRKKDDHLLGTGFINRWVKMKNEINPKRSAFTYTMSKDDTIECPIAHGEGRYTTENSDLIKKLEANEQIVLRYCDDKNKTINNYPVNPNGAISNIAAIINSEGNIMAAMPHFEHFYTIGKPVFDSIYQYVLDGSSLDNLNIPKCENLSSDDEIKISDHKIEERSIQMIIKLIITDKEEDSVLSVLKNIGFDNIKLERFLHYEIAHKYEKSEVIEMMEGVIRSGELLNTNKESVDVNIDGKTFHYTGKGLVEGGCFDMNDKSFLVREIDDYIGKGKCNTLKERLNFSKLESISRGVLWGFENTDKEIKDVLNTRILHNPHAQKLLKYSKN